MSEKIVDIGTQSSIKDILDKLDINIGFTNKVIRNNSVVQRVFDVGSIPGSATSCAMFTYNHNLYIVPNESDTIYIMSNDRHCWMKAFVKLPFSINVFNTRLLVYDNPISNTTELHILGGYGKLSKVHFRYDLKNNGGISIASDLPYDFCAGKAIVFKNEIHIFGGGTSEFSTKDTIPSGFLNNHYKWNGTSWERASNLVSSCYGATPFVCNNILHLIGGYNTDTGRAVYSFNSSSKTWISRVIDEPSGYVVQHPSISVISNTAYILGGVYDNNIKIQVGNSSPSTIPILDTDLSFPVSNSINSQCLIELDGTLYMNIGKYVYLQKYISGEKCIRYKTINESIDNMVPIVKYNSNSEKCLSLALLGNTGKRFIDVDNDITESVNFSLSSGIATNDKGDIYMFSDTSIKTNALAYIKKTDSDGNISYEANSFKLSEGFTNPLVAWYNNKFHIISNGDIYNHYLISNYNSSLEQATLFPDNLNDSMTLNSICVFKDSMYVMTVKDSIATLYSLTDNEWRKLYSLDVTSPNSVSLVSYQNRLNAFILSNGKILHYIWSKDKLILISSTITDWVSMKGIVYDNALQLIGTNSLNATSRIAYNYKVDSSSDYQMLHIELNKGRRLICDKDSIIPIYGYVMELDNGYEAIESGTYSFICMNNAYYTLT